MPLSLGAHSPKLEAVRALRTKAGRSEQRRYAIEGATLLREALGAGLAPEAIYATEAGYGAIAAAAEAYADRTFLLPERAFARLSELESPPGILAILPVRLEPFAKLLESGEPVLLLTGISDPGNAGTLLRSAEIFGIGAAIFGFGGVEPHAPKVVRSAMGAHFRMRLANAAPDGLATAARAAGYSIVAASRAGSALADFAFPERLMLAIGSERHGVEGWLPHWDLAVSIPHFGEGESLNAAVAGGIILYTYSQQRTRIKP